MSNLKKNGFKIINLDKKKLEKLKSQTISLFKDIYKIKKDLSLSDLPKYYLDQKKKHYWDKFYNLSSKQSLVYSILLDKKILNELKKYGYKNPGILPENCGLRFDFPNIEKTRFMPHQDSPYNTGGINNVTVWIPLMTTDERLGSLRIYSNFKKKIIKHRLQNKKLICDNYVKNTTFTEKFIKLGKGIFMNQCLIHSSGKNRANIPRITILGRYFDFYDLKFKYKL